MPPARCFGRGSTRAWWPIGARADCRPKLGSCWLRTCARLASTFPRIYLGCSNRGGQTMTTGSETKAELSKAGARFVSATGGNGHPREVIETPQRQPIMATLETLKARSNDNWAALIAAIHRFVDDQRQELDRLERWLGTK